MKWFGKVKDKASSDNRGSTIIVVLVTMTFLTVLASVLLYLSLINLQMKKIDKAGKTNFYSAEAVMNEIRAGVQEAASDAIKNAYTNVLVSYNTDSKDQQTINFRNGFFSDLYTKPMFISSGTSYDPGVLASFSSAPSGKASVSGSGVVQTVLDGDGNMSAVILKAVSVKYTANGYETTVSADIKIQAPDLPYTSASSKQTAIPDFAVVAGGTLLQPVGNGTVSVSGNVCARDLTVGGAQDNFYVQNASYFVLGGPVTVTNGVATVGNGAVTVNGGLLSLNAHSTLWGGNIKLDAGGQLSIGGDAYVANDLNLYGNETKAVLSGRYYGFGNDPSNPNKSSSILINGRDTVLDMSALRALLLAGHGYVNYGTGDQGYIQMGESISVKSNQLAYLVPDSCLSGVTNPYQYDVDPGNAALQAKVQLNQPVMNGKTLADYGITSAANNIAYIRKSVGAKNLIYICLKFSTSEQANAYFRDYYNANGSTVQKYLNIYSNGITLQHRATKNLAGEAFTFDGSTLGSIIDWTNVPTATLSEISSSYANLCVTLSRTESAGATGATTAYAYFVNASELSSLPEETMRYPSDGPAKVIVTGASDFTFDADDLSNDSVHVVIARQNVTVKGAYSGLILAGGNVTLSGGTAITANRAAVADALQALLAGSGDAKYYMYLNPQVISPMNVSTNTSGKAEIWDLNALVVYENWAKNET